MIFSKVVSRREEFLKILHVRLEFAKLERFRRVEWLIWKSNTMFGEDKKIRQRRQTKDDRVKQVECGR